MTAMRNHDTRRPQRCSLETWDQIMALSERYQVLPLDFLATVMDLAGEQVTERLEMLYGHRTGTTLSLTSVKAGGKR
jgi:hypothetical protein